VWFSQIWAAVLLAAGVVVLTSSFVGMRGLVRARRTPVRPRDARILFGLVAVFIVGYAAVLTAVVAGRFEALLVLVGALSVLGAMFVRLLVRVGQRSLQSAVDTRLSEHQLSELHDALGDALALVDPDGRIRVVNRRLCELVLRPASALLGRPVGELLVDDLAHAVPRDRDDPPYRGETNLRCGADDLKIAAGVCIAHAGPQLGLLYLFKDLRRERRKQRRLDEAVRIAEETLRGRNEYTARIVRELQEPLVVLTRACHGLDPARGSLAPTDIQAAGAAIAATGAAVVRSLPDLLAAGRLGGSLAGARLFYPVALIHDVADTLALDAARVGSEVRVEVAPDVPTQCHGREAELREVLELLGLQLIYQAPRSEIVLSVASGRGEAPSLVLSVRSGGPIQRTSSHLNGSLVVSPDSGDTNAVLDLVVCRLLVLSLGGSLTIERPPGASIRCVFTVPTVADAAPLPLALSPEIPLATDATLRLSSTSRQLAALATAPAPPTGARVDRGAVLIIDDSATTSAVLAHILRADGHTVATAATARDGLAMVWDRDYDVVLLDVQLPDSDGIGVLGQLRARGALDRLSVLMVSSLDEATNVATCIEQGAEDYLVKPISPAVLRARIGACLDRKQLQARSKQQLVRLAAESRRASDLLRTLLPEPIAEELQATGTIVPRRHERVAVLFVDVVDFTAYCDRHSPEEVLVGLQELFGELELLAEQHGALKIKTIGDALMVAAGLFAADPNPALRCVTLGLAMLGAVTRLSTGWAVRIGVHVGPVVAGVAGLRQHRFDIWGDTVNIAQRVEHGGQPGAVCVSAAVRDAIAGTYAARSRGPALAKGKGALEIFEVTVTP
jgi:adenylate cyclase